MEKIIYYTNSGEFEAEELLPCPFCGGEPEFITIGNEATKKRKAQIECTKCHVRRTTGAIRNSLEWCGRKAIELWNARWQETSNESAALPLHGVINWVATIEMLPENRQQVLCWNGHRMMQNSWCAHTDQDDKWFKERFTHWGLLPKPPCL